MSKTIKNIIIIVVLVAIAIVVYSMFFSGGDEPASTSGLQSTTTNAPVSGIIQTQSVSSIQATQIGQEFINQLLNLQAIKLNDEVFASLAFQSLEDFTIVLVQPGNEGRQNPFAPFGADTVPDPNASLPGITETNLNVTPSNSVPPTSPTPLPDLSAS